MFDCILLWIVLFIAEDKCQISLNRIKIQTLSLNQSKLKTPMSFYILKMSYMMATSDFPLGFYFITSRLDACIFIQ